MSSSSAHSNLDNPGAARSAADVLDHHLGAFAQGIDAILSDYHPRAVLITADATYQDLTEIRGFFDAFVSSATPEFWSAFRIERREVVGDVAYITWSSRPAIALATDTLVVAQGQIVTQTFTLLG